MGKFSEKLEELYDEAKKKLINLIDKKGVKSEHYSDKCLKIKDDELMFNLSGGRYLTEIKKSGRDDIELIDDGGYSYQCSAMENSEDFFLVVDHLIETYK